MSKKHKKEKVENNIMTVTSKSLYLDLNVESIEYVAHNQSGVQQQRVLDKNFFDMRQERTYRFPMEDECKILSFNNKFQNVFYSNGYINVVPKHSFTIYPNAQLCVYEFTKGVKPIANTETPTPEGNNSEDSFEESQPF